MLRHEAYQRLLHDLLSGICAALMKSTEAMSDSRRQALSSIIWSLGTLQCVQLQLVQITAGLVAEQLALFKPFELVSTVWAFAKLGALHPVVCQIVAPILSAAVAPIAQVVSKLGLRFLAMAAWALAGSGLRDQQLLGKIATRLVPMLRAGVGCRQVPELLVDVAWAFSSQGMRSMAVLGEVAAQAVCNINHFTARQLAELYQMLLSEGVTCPNFFDACRGRLRGTPAPKAETMSAASAAPQAGSSSHVFQTPYVEDSNRFGLPPCQTVSFTSAVAAGDCTAQQGEVQRCTASTANCDDVFSDVCSRSSEGDLMTERKTSTSNNPRPSWADTDDADYEDWSPVQDACCKKVEASSSSTTAYPSAVRCSVKNTFLELDDEERTEEEAEIMRRLPVALDCARAHLPHEELSAIRIRYQQLREW